jgi:hypothetical protein
MKDRLELLDTLARKLVVPLVDRSRWQAPTLVRVDAPHDVRTMRDCPPYGVPIVTDRVDAPPDAEVR